MKIETNGKTYTMERDSNGWTLEMPTIIKNKKTGEEKPGKKTIFPMNAGQCLAAIADRELGAVKSIEEMGSKIEELRKDLLSFKCN